MTRCFCYKVFLLQGVFVTRWVWVLQIQLWDSIVKRLPRQWKAVSPRRRGCATSSRGSSRSLHCERRGSSRWSSAARAGTTSWTHSSVSSRGSSCASSSKKTQSIKMTRLVLWKCDGRRCQYNADQINRFSAPAVGRWPSCSAVHGQIIECNIAKEDGEGDAERFPNDFVNNIWGKVLQPSLCTGWRNGQEFRKDGLPIPQVPDTHLKGARLNFSKTHGWAGGHYNGHYEPLKG